MTGDFTTHHLFNIKNYDPSDQITAVASGSLQENVAIGTMQGIVYIISRFTSQLLKKYTAHNKSITQIYLKEKENKVFHIITSSSDGFLNIFMSDKPDSIIKNDFTKYYEISCFVSTKTQFNEFVIGFGQGDLIFYKESIDFFGNKQKQISSMNQTKNKDSIVMLKQYEKIIAWATRDRINVAYYPKSFGEEGKPLCKITNSDLKLFGDFKKNPAIIPSMIFQ